MPRKRMIHPGFWDDPDIARLEPLDRLLAIGMISLADDWGNTMADEFYLKKKIFGFDPITQFQVEAMRDRIFKQCRNFTRYEVDGQVYVHLENWEKHQTLRYKAKPEWPPAPGQDCSNTGWRSSNVDDNEPNDCGKVAQDCDNSAQIGGLREDKQREDKQREEKAASSSMPAAAALEQELRDCGVTGAKLDDLKADPWVTAERVRACWASARQRNGVDRPVGLLIRMLQDHDQPPRASPEPGSQEERYRYIRGKFAEYINVGVEEEA